MPYKDPLKKKEWSKQYNKKYRPEYCRKRREWFKTIKADLSCIKCGESRIVCLDFHHRNPKEKEGSIGRLIYNWSKKKILREITKCDVLCANCHRVEHEGEPNG